jgi:hypothetical protein
MIQADRFANFKADSAAHSRELADGPAADRERDEGVYGAGIRL